MDYPTRTWRHLGQSYYRLLQLLPEDRALKEHPDFSGQLTAICPGGSLIAAAYKADEIVRITGRLTSEQIEERRRSVLIYDQVMNVVQRIPVQTQTQTLQLGWTRSGLLAVLTMDGEV